MKPIGVKWQQFIEYRMPDGSIEGRSCAPWIPPLCARLAVILQSMHQLWLRVAYTFPTLRQRRNQWTKTP